MVFRRSAFYLPFKAVYVKTNSGEDGYGSVTNVTYEDILIRDPILWCVLADEGRKEI